jgi:hypothetical protein
LHSPQPYSNHPQPSSHSNSLFKMCSQIGNLLLKLGVLFGSMEKLTL